ncbi:MAG: LD-carboxypeptidase [Desulfocapsaceae bacterium]|nr:LD-carboxypeptidase [Desulfocapsaceae bacterium]
MAEPCPPPALAPGASIGIVAPAGQIKDRQRFESGVQALTDMGFTVRLPPSLWSGTGYLSDSDQRRAEEFNRTWADPKIDALMAVRGGYGCLRMLELIDLQMIRRTPKLLAGFSDITVLHTFLQRETGLISLHGPVLTSLAGSDAPSRERFRQCLLGNWQKVLHWKKLEILRAGEASRRKLIGGNLTSLVSLLGTPFAPRWQDKILFLEDTNEPLYRLDRMLTQLSYAGVFKAIKGLILGDFSMTKDMDSLQRLRHHEAVWGRALELTAVDSLPVWGGFPIGHQNENMTLPVGAMATMGSAGALHFG